MQKSLDFDYIFKYILVGDASVGKSTILNMFINSFYQQECNPTMGVQFATKKVKVMGRSVKIQIWDTAGQESFRTITRAYYKNAIGVILVYDLSNPTSLNTIDSWIKEIYDNYNDKAQIMLVGNKADLVGSLKVGSPKSEFTFMTTSAKTGHNINKLFVSLTESILKKIDEGIIHAEGVLDANTDSRGEAGPGQIADEIERK